MEHPQTIFNPHQLSSTQRSRKHGFNPLNVLRFQEKNADPGATLDFIIPPKTDPKEAQRRLALTLKNALYALDNIHVFGIGSTKLIPLLLDCGADSFDSSGYVRAAVGVREKTEGLAGLHTNLYSALNNLSKINDCFGCSFTMPSAPMFDRHQPAT